MRALLFFFTIATVVVAFSPSQFIQQQQHRYGSRTTTTTTTTSNRINESANAPHIISSTQLSVATEVVANGVAAKLKKSRQVSENRITEFLSVSSSNITLNVAVRYVSF